MRILLVEDDGRKAGSIIDTIRESLGDKADISHKLSLVDAVAVLFTDQFDLCLLDVVLPRRLGEDPSREGGKELLRAIHRDHRLKPPKYVVGISAFADVVDEEKEEFSAKLWSLIHFSDSIDQWKGQLDSILLHISSVLGSDSFTDGKTYGHDLAIICALSDVEFEAIERVDLGWNAVRRPYDDTRYLEGAVHAGGKNRRVIAAAAPRMGMAATACLASKVIMVFRPRYLALVGICAGRKSKVELGDIIVASPSWDWGSGRIESSKEGPKFLPTPHQLDISIDVRAEFDELRRDVELLARIKENCQGPKPKTETGVHIAPLVSGAAVVADSATFDSLLDQHRKIAGLEMEAYAAFVAAQSMGRPRPEPIVVKAVSDFADDEKADDYQAFAAELSVRFLMASADGLFKI